MHPPVRIPYNDIEDGRNAAFDTPINLITMNGSGNYFICKNQKMPVSAMRLVNVHEGPCGDSCKKAITRIHCVRMKRKHLLTGIGGDVLLEHLAPGAAFFVNKKKAEEDNASLGVYSGISAISGKNGYLELTADLPLVVCKNQCEDDPETVRCHYVVHGEGHQSDCSCGSCGFVHELEAYPSGVEGGCHCHKRVISKGDCCIM